MPGTKMTLNRYGKQNFLDKTDFELFIDESNIALYSAVPILIALPEDYVMGRKELDVTFNGQYLINGAGFEEVSPNTIRLDLRDAEGNSVPLSLGDEIAVRMWRNKTVQGLEADRDRLSAIDREVQESRGTFPKLGDRISDMDERLDVAQRKVVVFVMPGGVNVGAQTVEIRFPFPGVIEDVYASCRVAPTTHHTIQVEKISQAEYNLANESGWKPTLRYPVIIDENTKSSKASFFPYEILDPVVAADDLFRINTLTAGEGARDITVEVTVKCLS